MKHHVLILESRERESVLTVHTYFVAQTALTGFLVHVNRARLFTPIWSK